MQLFSIKYSFKNIYVTMNMFPKLFAHLPTTFLEQMCSFLLPAYCFACTSLASRSMIAQVSEFLVFPKENHRFLNIKGTRLEADFSKSLYFQLKTIHFSMIKGERF